VAAIAIYMGTHGVHVVEFAVLPGHGDPFRVHGGWHLVFGIQQLITNE